MATGYGGSRDKNSGFSSSGYPSNSVDNHYSSRSDNYDKDSADLNDMTLEVVGDFKRIVQNKIQDGKKLSEPIVELDVANIRQKKYPDECNFNQCKRHLPRDIQDCPDSILRVSMAYGNNPDEIKSILQTKMNNTNSNINSTDSSLSNIIGPLRRLKGELDKNQQPNIFRAVQNIDDRDINRANRLFFSEACHFAPAVKDFKFSDAQNAVQAIRQTNYESDDPKDLLPFIKTFQDVDEILEYLDNKSKSSMKKNESPIKSSSIFPSIDHTTSNSIPNNPNRNTTDQTSTFYYRPLPDPFQNSPQPSGQSDNRSRDEPTRGPTRRNSERK